MKSVYLLITSILLGLTPLFSNNYHIIPEPVSINYTNGVMKLSSKICISADKNLTNEVLFLSNILKDENSVASDVTTNTKKADIIMTLDNNMKKKEEYVLQITPNKIIIKASNNHGIFNAVQTLSQIVREYKKVIPCGVIVDYPRFSWRAFMLDEARYFKGKKVVYDILDRMAELKMNIFHWHLTDHQGWRIEIKKYPLLTEIGAYRDSSMIGYFGSNKYDGVPHSGYYTQNDIRDIVDYAKKRHIQIVPEIDMPGHSSAAIAAYPWLGSGNKKISVPCKFGPHYEVYNITRPEVKNFLKDVLSEVIELFPSSIIHIGGDEVRYDYWNNSKQIKDYMIRNNLNTPTDLQIAFTNEISDWLYKNNFRMMGWNEIAGDKVHDYQKIENEVSTQLAPNTIVHFWSGNPDLITTILKKGYNIVNSFNKYTYLDYNYEQIPLSKAYSFEPVPINLNPNDERKILGIGCQMWCEFVPNIEKLNLQVFPRIAAIAEVGWTLKDNKSYKRFIKSMQYMDRYWKSIGVIGFPIQ